MKALFFMMTAVGIAGLFFMTGCGEDRGMNTTHIYYITQVTPDQQHAAAPPADDSYFYVNENGEVVEGNATDQADEPDVVYVAQEPQPQVVVVDNPYPVYTSDSWVGVTFGGVYDYGCGYPYGYWPYPCGRRGYDRYRPYHKKGHHHHHPKHGGGIRESVVYYDKAGNRLTPPRSPYIKSAPATPRRDRNPAATRSNIDGQIGGVRIGGDKTRRRPGSQRRSPAADRLIGNIVYYTPAGDRITPTVRPGSRHKSAPPAPRNTRNSGTRFNTLPRGGVITGGSYPTGGMRPGSGGVDTSGRPAGSSGRRR